MHQSISDFIVDLVQNSVEAGSKSIVLDVAQTSDEVSVQVIDDGKGMRAEVLETAKDPFANTGAKHAKRKVGLGIPFLLQAVNLAGGRFDIVSMEGSGTRVSFSFPLGHVDTPPFGEFDETLVQLLCFAGDYGLEIRRSFLGSRGDASYTVTKAELEESLGDLSDTEALVLARRYLRSQEESIRETAAI